MMTIYYRSLQHNIIVEFGSNLKWTVVKKKYSVIMNTVGRTYYPVYKHDKEELKHGLNKVGGDFLDFHSSGM